MIVLIVLLAVAAGWAAYRLSPPRYESTVSFLVQPNSDSSSSAEIYQGELLAQTRAQLYGRLVPGPDLAGLVSARLGGDPEPGRIQDAVTTSVQSQSPVFDVTVSHSSPAVVEAVSLALADELPGYTTRLQASPTLPATTVRVVSQPGPARQVAPTLVGSIGLALFGGLLVALLVAVLREATNRRVRDLDDLRGLLGATAVCVDLGRSRRRQRRADEAVVRLSVLIAAAAARNRPVAVVPLSPNPGTAAWVLDLAGRLSTDGERVVVVDADLARRPLSSADVDRASGVEIVSADSVAATAAGGGVSHSAEALSPEVVGAAVVKVVSAASERADVVLVATGSLLLRSRPALLATEEAEVVVLVERGRTAKEDVRTAVEVVRQLGSEVGGGVLAGQSHRFLPRG
ncbi:hypothetical protein ACI797_16640 [Geodermatophilus sp. SYSU D00691]